MSAKSGLPRIHKLIIKNLGTMETNIENPKNLESETQGTVEEVKVRQLVPPQEAFDKQREIEKQYLETVKQANK